MTNPLQGSNVFAVKMSVAAEAAVKTPSATDLLATIVPFSVRVGILVASAGSDEIGKKWHCVLPRPLIGAEFLPAVLRQAGKPFICSSEGGFKGGNGVWIRQKWKHHTRLSWCGSLFARCLCCRLYVSCTSSKQASSSSFFCRVQTLILIAVATGAHESRTLFLKVWIHPSIKTTPSRKPPVGLVFFFVCVCVLLGRTFTWIFLASFLSSLLLFARSDRWVTEPTLECRNKKKQQNPQQKEEDNWSGKPNLYFGWRQQKKNKETV